MEIEHITDSVYEMTEDIDPALVLQALVATIMGTAGRCADPHRALLGVIAELTDLIRFMESPKEGGRRKPLTHNAWVRDTWEAAEPKDEADEDEDEPADDIEALANWAPPQGTKPQ